MEGLHEHVPIAVSDGVMRVVWAPALDEAAAASQPAWPAPMTTTWVVVLGWKLAKEDMVNGLLRHCERTRLRGSVGAVTRSIVSGGCLRYDVEESVQ